MHFDDNKYLEIFLHPVRQCKSYKPKFGQGNSENGISLNEFKELYRSDIFYSWLGLDNDLMYTAHRAAGGMTSVYRQIGIGCERVFREMIVDAAAYSNPSYAKWSYTAMTQSGKSKTLSLDGRLELNEINNRVVLENITNWIQGYCHELGGAVQPSKGVVFEIRQGYKSKDSKRQNADIDNAAVAWANGYMPVFAVYSSQIDSGIVLRYRNNRCGVLVGTNDESIYISLFTFCKQVMGYDLAGFFQRQSISIQNEIHDVLEKLLRSE